MGVHRSTSLMSSSLLLQQCPACLVRRTCIVFVMGGKCPYSWSLVGCCRQDLFMVPSILQGGRLRCLSFDEISVTELGIHNLSRSSDVLFSYFSFISFVWWCLLPVFPCTCNFTFLLAILCFSDSAVILLSWFLRLFHTSVNWWFLTGVWRLQIAQFARAVEITDPTNECPGYNTKQYDGEFSIMLAHWGMRSTPSLQSLPGPLWPKEDPIYLSNRTKLCNYAKLNLFEKELFWI